MPTRSLLAVALLIAWCVTVCHAAPLGDADRGAVAEASAPVLVRGVDGAPPPLRPGIERSRAVAIQPDVLAVIEPGLAVRLELFEDITPTIVIERVEVRPTRLVISGRTSEAPGGRLLMVSQGGLVSAELTLPEGVFRIRGQEDGGSTAMQLEDRGDAECGTGPREHVFTEEGDAAGGGVAGVCDDGTVVDIIIFYTSIARQEAGGAGPIETDIALAVEATNEAYVNSGIETQLNLLLTQEIAYNENGGYADHLYRLTNPGDGIMDEAHLLREQLGADLVSLFVDDNQYCGIAWLMANVGPGFEDNGFSVVTWFCSALVLGHEFGHNMGCHHDHDNASSSAAYHYSYGHRWNGDSGGLWRTVMSYSPGVRISNFSSPDVLFDGQPTGVPDGQPQPADNALTINQTRTTIANFRCSAPPIGITVYHDRAAFEALLASPTTVDFEGVPDVQAIARPAGYEWDGLIAGEPMLQVDRLANVAGAPFVSDFIASSATDAPVAFDLGDVDAIGASWFHGESAQSGFDGLFRITLSNGVESNYLVPNIGTGEDMTDPDFVGFVSACDTISRIEYFALTPVSSTTSMADDVTFGSTGYGCPENDDCTNATTVALGSTPFTTVNATTDGTNDVLCGGAGATGVDADVWFKYVADCDVPVTVSVCDAAFDVGIAVYESFCPTFINEAIACEIDGCGSDGASITFDATAGTIYRIRVGSPGGGQGDGTLVITTAECIPAPSNDDCGDSRTITEGEHEFTTLGATTDGPAEGGCAYDGAPQIEQDVWFRFIAQCDETITVELCDIDFEPRMALYTGPCPNGSGEVLACSAGSCSAAARLSFPATAGTLYRVRVGGAAPGQAGSGTLSLTCGAPPPACPPDVDGNGAVDVDDLVTVILAWDSDDAAADVNADGIVDVDDLVEVILAWGPCE